MPNCSIPSDLAALLRQAKRIAVLTGAGISAESGVPTFRDAQTGLWARFRPEDLATPEAFLEDPKLVWEWYAWRRELVAKAAPNPGHLALVELEQRAPHFTLITQNVDGLHRTAGNRNLIELHGSIYRTKCFDEGIVVDHWEPTDSPPPHCPHCGSLLRPDVVWFGEALPTEALHGALQATEACDLFLSIGTSSLVQPAASLPIQALHQGATLVEINPDATPLTAQAHYALRASAGIALPALLQAAWPDASP